MHPLYLLINQGFEHGSTKHELTLPLAKHTLGSKLVSPGEFHLGALAKKIRSWTCNWIAMTSITAFENQKQNTSKRNDTCLSSSIVSVFVILLRSSSVTNANINTNSDTTSLLHLQTACYTFEARPLATLLQQYTAACYFNGTNMPQ